MAIFKKIDLRTMRRVMVYMFLVKHFMRFTVFALMFLLGALSFNLFHLKEKLKMIQVVNAYHRGQFNDDKKLIYNLLTDDFTESGVSHAIRAPEAIDKSNAVNFPYSEINYKSIEAKYLILFNMLSNSNKSLSFVRNVTFFQQSDNTPVSINYYVTYSFEEGSDGLKINKIERKL